MKGRKIDGNFDRSSPGRVEWEGVTREKKSWSQRTIFQILTEEYGSVVVVEPRSAGNMAVFPGQVTFRGAFPKEEKEGYCSQGVG